MSKNKQYGPIVAWVLALMLLVVPSAKADGGFTSTTAEPSAPAAVAAASISTDPPVANHGYYEVQGSGIVPQRFSYVYRNSNYSNQLSVFKVDSTDGAINGVRPGDPTWPSAVALRTQEVFPLGSNASTPDVVLPFQGGDILGLSFTANGQTFYSFDQANADGSHVRVYQDSGGQIWQYAWDDGGAGGFRDGDYNDGIYDIQPASTDTTPPTVSLTEPASGAQVTNTVPVTADASDDTGVAGVQFQLDGQNLGDEQTAAPYTISWDSTAVSDGYHTLTAIARDAAGNQTVASGVEVLVLNTVSNGEGDEATSAPITPELQTHRGCGAAPATSGTDAMSAANASCANANWCSSKNEAWGPVIAPHVEWRNRITRMLYWRARASVNVCIDLKRGVITDFDDKSARMTPLYTLPLIWHYDNSPNWSYGVTGSKAKHTSAEVTDSFTGCPLFNLPIGCSHVTFTVHFDIAGSGIYSYHVTFQGA